MLISPIFPPVLISLNLSGNELCGVDKDGDEENDASGIKALASALMGNAVLTSLELRLNKLDAEAGIALAGAVKVNSVLTKLPAGGIAIAKALEVNAVLAKLHLDWNNIGVEGGKAIAEALKSTLC